MEKSNKMNKTYKTLKKMDKDFITNQQQKIKEKQDLEKAMLNETVKSTVSMSKPTKKQQGKKKNYTYQSYLDEMNFVPKHKELKSLIDRTNDKIRNVIYELANKTKNLKIS